jgi:hypothetical protein
MKRIDGTHARVGSSDSIRPPHHTISIDSRMCARVAGNYFSSRDTPSPVRWSGPSGPIGQNPLETERFSWATRVFRVAQEWPNSPPEWPNLGHSPFRERERRIVP